MALSVMRKVCVVQERLNIPEGAGFLFLVKARCRRPRPWFIVFSARLDGKDRSPKQRQDQNWAYQKPSIVW